MAKARIATLFPTRLYRADLKGAKATSMNDALAKTALAFAQEDVPGQRWSKKHDYTGYTSYASLDDLPTRASVFDELKAHLDMHARAFARTLDFDFQGKRLVLDSLWVNVMEKNAVHAAHIHPHSVLSGTYYVKLPKNAAEIRFEDPRLGLMMAAPSRKENARTENKNFVSVAPKQGTILMWESWLRHEVRQNRARSPRISVSFNYAMA